ncbi:hypothetical protein MASR2M15_02230 [Anaerolineales bacterium]
MSIDVQEFKNIMSHWATGISIVTAAKDNQLYGLTANSFTSVSIDPPTVSVNVAKRLEACAIIQETRHYAVSILTEKQIEIAKIFAGMIHKEDRFEGLNYLSDQHNCPIIPDSFGWLGCEVIHEIDLGSNILFIGKVLEGNLDIIDSDPLLYHHRKWGTFKSVE